MADEEAVRVPMDVRYHGAWLTWVASTTGCLEALGVECDTVDVAGYSGLAFLMNVHEELCPSGPTAWDWGLLLQGVHVLGRSTLAYHGGECHSEGADERTPVQCRAAHELVEQEVRAGRPCVIWGAYVPEFAIAVGVQAGSYLVKSFRECRGEPQPPVPYDALQAPGGAYVLAFPTPSGLSREHADRYAVSPALAMAHLRSGDARYATGLAAYDLWANALEAGKAGAFGNSYNAQCWAEAKHFAHEFLGRLAERSEAASDPLRRAEAAYARTAEAMGRLAHLFPFPGNGGQTDDAAVCAQAIDALRDAQRAEAEGLDALAGAAT